MDSHRFFFHTAEARDICFYPYGISAIRLHSHVIHRVPVIPRLMELSVALLVQVVENHANATTAVITIISSLL